MSADIIYSKKRLVLKPSADVTDNATVDSEILDIEPLEDNIADIFPEVPAPVETAPVPKKDLTAEKVTSPNKYIEYSGRRYRTNDSGGLTLYLVE